MEVVCGPEGPSGPREHVTINSGYAIDCNGNDIIFDDSQSVNFFDMIPTSPPGSVPPDSDYSLILDPSVREQFRAVPYVPETSFQSLFDGSILMDFYNDCVKSVIDLFTSAFSTQSSSSSTASQLITPQQQNVDVFTNLLAQYLNPDSGSYVYISGYQPAPLPSTVVTTPPTEDAVLRNFYAALKGKLQSETYCAMFDNARPFPAYPFRNQVSSIYSKSFKTGLRIDPTGKRAYTFGIDNNIFVFDLSSNQLNSIIQFPAAGVVVQDLAFSSNGSQVYAVATLSAQQETMFEIANVNGFTHTWFAPGTIICNMLISTLAMISSDTANVYALEMGNGIYKINIANPSTTPPTVVSKTFCAFGHLVVDDLSGFAYATSNSATAVGQVPTNFNQVQRINLKTPGTNEVTYTLNANGTSYDDIGVVPVSPVSNGTLFVTTEVAAGNSQQVGIYPSTTASTVQTDLIVLGGATVTTLRFAFNPVSKVMMLSAEDGNRIQTINQAGAATLTAEFSFPTEYGPYAIAYCDASGSASVYVLNYSSNTISVVPANMFVPTAQIDLTQLLTYRTAVINAFLDLLGGFIQYLKDCFCDHILVKCPSCQPTDELYLGTVSIRNGQISKVCNFSQRKYVKSFPTVGYWMSLIPIVPMIKSTMEKICCSALPDYFAGLSAPQPSAAIKSDPTQNSYIVKTPAKTVHGAIGTVQNFSVSKTVSSAISSVNLSKSIGSDYLQTNAQRFRIPTAGVSTSSVLRAERRSLHEPAADFQHQCRSRRPIRSGQHGPESGSTRYQSRECRPQQLRNSSHELQRPSHGRDSRFRRRSRLANLGCSQSATSYPGDTTNSATQCQGRHRRTNRRQQQNRLGQHHSAPAAIQQLAIAVVGHTESQHHRACHQRPSNQRFADQSAIALDPNPAGKNLGTLISTASGGITFGMAMDQRPRIAIGVYVAANPSPLTSTLAALARNTSVPFDLLIVPESDLGSGQRQPEIVANPGTAFNHLVQKCSADVYVFLESGAFVAPNWLDAMLDVIRRAPRSGVVGPSTNRAASAQAAFPDTGDDVVATAAAARRRFGNNFRSLSANEHLEEFCFAVRREVIERIGPASARSYWHIDYASRAAAAAFPSIWACSAYVHRSTSPCSARPSNSLHHESAPGTRLNGVSRFTARETESSAQLSNPAPRIEHQHLPEKSSASQHAPRELHHAHVQPACLHPAFSALFFPPGLSQPRANYCG